MANLKSLQVTNGLPIPSADRAIEIIPIVATFVVPAGLALNDVIEMGPLQAGYVPVDILVALPDMDSNGTPLITVDCGIMSGNWLDSGVRTCGNEFFAASTAAQTGGVARLTKAAGAQIAPTTNDRSWGLKIAAAAATLAIGGTITATLFVRPKIEGI